MNNISDGVWPTMITPYTEDIQIDWNGVDKLVDWYIGNGVSGIFAVCLSSEIFHLEFEERIKLAKRIAGRCKGKVEVISGVTIEDLTGISSDNIKKVYETGVKAAVCLVNQLFPKDKSDAECFKAIEVLLSKTGNIPLGLYECPVPYHKLLTPELLKFLIGTGRFYFLKDTSCDLVRIKEKLGIMKGTNCKFFNANTPTLLESLEFGGSGYSGIASNYYPELYAWLCRNFKNKPERAREVSDFLSVSDSFAHNKYSTAAKYYLQLCGVQILTKSRSSTNILTDTDKMAVESLYRIVKQLKATL